MPIVVNQSTLDEVNFLNDLGSHISTAMGAESRGVSYSKFTREEVLKRYLDAMDKRKDWGKIDKNTVKKHVLELLRLENEKGGL